MKRREFLQTGGLLASSWALGCGSPTASTGGKSYPPDSFFTTGRRAGRWWFLTPQGEPFFSIGLNHIDSATLRYAGNVHIWREKYGNSQQRWLQESVRPDLEAWGFNTAGWVQEVVTRVPTNHRHSRNFTFEEYQWLGMPYCHMLPFADFHQWEAETRHPDLMSSDFEQWCDYVARAECARMAGDPKLIGYFYIDCPTWVHTRPQNQWKGPLFDPEKLNSEAGRKALFDLASRYYQVTHDAIRRYDRNHLILGDRYEGRAPLPDEVLLAARPYVDVFSFQYFGPAESSVPDLRRWGELTGKPVLLADAAVPGRRGDLPKQPPGEYEPMMKALRGLPSCVGWHYCGAYLRNRARYQGLRDENENPDEEFVAEIARVNRETQEWAAKAGA